MTSPDDLLTIACIVKGFWSKANEIDLNPSGLHDEGECGLMMALVEYEVLDTEVFNEDNNVDYVWVYQISEPFGEWIAAFAKMTGRLPGNDQCLTQLRHLVQQSKT